MTFDELQLRIEAAFPAEVIVETAVEGDCVEFLVVRPGCRVLIYWEPHSWVVWCDRWEEATIRSAIEGVTAHRLIAARRRRTLEELARLDADLIMNELPAREVSGAH